MPALKWTMPIRRADCKVLSPLPPEIYLEIFEHLSPPKNRETPPKTRDIRNLARVCRYFRVVMIPRIFEMVFINAAAADEHSGTAFCRSICDGDEDALSAASHVKVFCFTKTYNDQPWSHKEFISLYAKAILHMRNLVELGFSRTSLTNGLLKAIISLPSLKKLALCRCTARKLRQHFLDQLSQLQLQTLHVENFLEIDQEYDPSMIATFTHLPLQHLAELKFVCPFILNQILAAPSLPNLKNLIAIARVDANLPKILSKMPNLKRLEIQRLNFSSSQTIFPGNLPNFTHLNEICAPMVVLKKLVPGTAISSVKVSYQSQYGFGYEKLSPPNEAEVKLLSQSRQPITSLNVPFSFYTAAQFSIMFPALRSLVLRPLHPNYEHTEGHNHLLLRESIETPLTRFLKSWPVHPPLYELVLDLMGIDRPENREHCVLGPGIQYNLSGMIPTLRFCTIQYKGTDDVDTWFFCEEAKLWRLMGGIERSPSRDS